MPLFSDSFQQFITTLATSSETPRVSQRALEALARELRIARMDVVLSVPENRFLPLGKHDALTLYDAGAPADKDAAYTRVLHTGDGGQANFHILRLAGGAPWTEDERAALDVIVDVCGMHSGRFRLIDQVRDGLFTNYLTGLPNSGGYLRQVGKRLHECGLSGYVALYFNLKGTSIINLRFGQQQGDEIIRLYACRLRDALMADELLGHLGGDNFVAMVRREREAEWLRRLAATEINFEQNGERIPLTVGACVGVMDLSDDIPGPWMLISGPAIAWQRAKADGHPSLRLTQEMYEFTNRTRIVENTFYQALNAGEFVPFYQPKVDMATGRIVGAEVLSRWIHDGRVVPPVQFIPILERTEEIADLDLHILEEACRDMSAWKARGHTPVPLSVNISRRDVGLPGIIERIEKCYEKYGILKGEILIEITETTNERESKQMQDFVHRLFDEEIFTSIDDFGTGYSSFNFLRTLPVRELKIDRSFINHPEIVSKDEIIIGSIINMAKRLGIDVITEGVETREQASFLLKLGCNRAQGFLYDKPMPRNEFEERLSKGMYSI